LSGAETKIFIQMDTPFRSLSGVETNDRKFPSLSFTPSSRLSRDDPPKGRMLNFETVGAEN